MAEMIVSLGTLVAFIIGAAVGMSELVARYKDAPLKALMARAAILYVVINGIASASALVLIKYFGWDFGLSESDPTALAATRVLIAGFGAMALFRSSLFSVRVGSSDIAIGPSSFLGIILAAADRGVDRERAEARANLVTEIMTGVSFTKAQISLPLTCFALLQNVPAEEQQNVSAEIKELAAADVPDHVKSLSLGLTLMDVVGGEALKSAVDSLGDEIKDTGPSAPAAPSAIVSS